MLDSNKIFDGLLVLQYRSGADKALSILVKKYHGKLCSHSYWYTQDIDASKDIVQDCWRIIMNKLDSLEDPNLFGSWAFRIVTRKSLNFIQKKKRESKKLHEFYEVSSLGLEADLVDNSVEIQRLLKAIELLPRDQQIVIRLFYKEDYSLKEISTILEISVGTVKSRLFHAREKLKLILLNE